MPADRTMKTRATAINWICKRSLCGATLTLYLRMHRYLP